MPDEGGAEATVDGRSYALFRVNGEIRAVDGACPHAGGPLAEGTVADGVVTCPWHGWTFDARTGCSLDPPGRDVARYPTLVEDGNVYLKPAVPARGRDAEPDAAPAGTGPADGAASAPRRLTRAG